MNLQAFEDKCPDSEKDDRDNPEVYRQVKAIPEPYMVHHRIPVSIGDVIKRVELENDDQPSRHRRTHRIQVPHDRCKPDLHLDDDVDDLRQIPEENDDGAGSIADAQTVEEQGPGIIQKLDDDDSGEVTRQREQKDHQADKENMHEQGRNLLDDRKDADLEDYLLDQIAVFQKGTRASQQRILEEEPGDETGNQPQHEGVSHAVLRRDIARMQTHLENEPVDQDRDGRLHESPGDSQDRTRIPGLEIIFRKLHDQMPVLDQFTRKR